MDEPRPDAGIEPFRDASRPADRTADPAESVRYDGDDAHGGEDGDEPKIADTEDGIADVESTPEGAIVLDGLTKRYGPTVALSDVTLEIRPGTVHGLIGPNGSGKTTLFRLIAGLSNPSSGRIERPPGGVGYSFQEPRFFPELTVRENLSIFRSIVTDPPPDGWTDTLLEELRLEPAVERRACELSGGFRKKLDLALALLPQPRYLLLDEPLADVDKYSRRKILSFFDSYGDDDRTILVSSHNAAAFEGIYDRVTILVDGELRADGQPDDASVARYRRQYG